MSALLSKSCGMLVADKYVQIFFSHEAQAREFFELTAAAGFNEITSNLFFLPNGAVGAQMSASAAGAPEILELARKQRVREMMLSEGLHIDRILEFTAAGKIGRDHRN